MTIAVRTRLSSLGDNGSGCHHDFLARADIGEMRRFFCFYTRCLKVAWRGIFQFANSYFWLIGALIVWATLRLFGYEMEIPSNIPGAIMAMSLFFVAAWLVGFLVRLIFVAPYHLFARAKSETATIETRAAQAEGRLREITTNPIPDIAIETRSVADIIERPDGGGLRVIIRDFHLTNRSDFAYP